MHDQDVVKVRVTPKIFTSSKAAHSVIPGAYTDEEISLTTYDTSKLILPSEYLVVQEASNAAARSLKMRLPISCGIKDAT